MEHLTLVGISFHTAGKVFDFDAKDFELKTGDKVIVETERGRALGDVVRAPRQVKPEEAPQKLKAVLRIASESDLEMAADNRAKEEEALKFCQEKVQQRQLDMKLVRAEYLFDGSKIIFYFTADGRIDFRELVRDLAQHYRTRIEMRQIGVRDEAKLVGGLGVCGRELCCATHLREFAPVSVKMAKAQGLALNPTKISGQCGRLLCCLAYEYETYNDLKKSLPKCGKKLQLKDGKAEVVALDILAQKVTLACPNGDRCQMHIKELQEQMEAPGAPAPEEKAVAAKGKKSMEAPDEEPSCEELELELERELGLDQEQEQERERQPRKTAPPQKRQNRRPQKFAKSNPDKRQEQRSPKAQEQRVPKDQEQAPAGSDTAQDNKARKRRRPRRRPGKPRTSENQEPKS